MDILLALIALTMPYYHHHWPSPDLFSPRKSETLHSLNKNFPTPSSPKCILLFLASFVNMMFANLLSDITHNDVVHSFSLPYCVASQKQAIQEVMHSMTKHTWYTSTEKLFACFVFICSQVYCGTSRTTTWCVILQKTEWKSRYENGFY